MSAHGLPTVVFVVFVLVGAGVAVAALGAVVGAPVVGAPVVGAPVVGAPVVGETVVGEAVAGAPILRITPWE